MTESAAPDPKDETLLAEARAGNTRAFEKLVTRHFGMSYAIALAYLRNRESAEDLAQEVLLRAYLFLPQFRQDTLFPNWIARTTRNLAIDWQRRRQHSSSLVANLPTGEMPMDPPDLSASTPRDQIAQAEEHAMIWQSLEQLPADQREIILLHYMEDLNLSEIAERCGGHRTTVSRNLARALRRMRGMMEPLLRESVGTLRPSRSAAAKSAAIIAAAAALSVEAKGALAAQATTTTLAAATAKAGTGWSALKVAAGLAVFFCLLIAGYLLRRSGVEAWSTTAGTVLDHSGPNAYPLGEELFGTTLSLTQRRARLPELLLCTHYTYPGGESAHSMNPAGQAALVPQFLNYQVASKISRVDSVFDLLLGQPDKAFQDMAAYVYVGHLMEHSNILMTRLIGDAIAQIATKGLETVVLNSCQSKDDYERSWVKLERLRQVVYPTNFDATCREVNANILVKWLSGPNENAKESVTRQLSTVATFDLLRMAVAARHCLMAKGHFPCNVTEFTLFANGALPEDPFSNRQPKPPLHFREDATSGDLLCYSVGPLETDDKGAIIYDPSNGTMSGGDIVVRVPRDRQYPFPAGGVHAATAAELTAQFPRGLPPDPFADTRGPLSIADTSPVRVYSYGPDTNQVDALKLGSGYKPDVQYDPTNGIVSAGDLILEIPR